MSDGTGARIIGRLEVRTPSLRKRESVAGNVAARRMTNPAGAWKAAAIRDRDDQVWRISRAPDAHCARAIASASDPNKSTASSRVSETPATAK